MSTGRETIINVDAGGTFTDCFTAHGDQIVTAKTPTTDYDLSECFIRSIEQCATDLGEDTERLLTRTDSIRYSTTIAMNKLIEREGPDIGLLTTAGVQDFPHIGRGAQWATGLTDREQRDIASSEKPHPLVTEELSLGIRERIDSTGEIKRPLDEDHAREQIRKLVDRGARAIVVSLLWGFKNPVHEHRIRELAREEFAPSYLGNVPVFLSSEVMPTTGEYERTQSVILDAYLSQLMQEHIADIKNRLEEFGYENELQMIHNTGGMAESYKTTAVNTYNGGPVAGLKGGETLSDRLGYEKAVVTDMGGTSFDIGLVVSGSTQSYEFEPTIGRFAVSGTMVESKSIGAGGGSIAWINEELGDRVEVGPKSAGADPGPACYNRGGTEPTVTDADVVLGYIDPDRFFGGRQTLDVESARDAIERSVADPLGIDVIEAAKLIREITDGNMGDTIRKETLLRGFDPREFVLYSLGGAGPVHCADFAGHIGIDEVLISPYSPVFCAFGSSAMDTFHIYEQSESLYLLQPGGQAYTDDYELFNSVVDNLIGEARRDLTGEGFDEDEIEYELDLQMRFGGQIHVARSPSPVLKLEDSEDAEAIYEQFVEEYKTRFSSYSVTPDQGVMIENFVLKARGPRSKVQLPSESTGDGDPSAARIGERDMHWEERNGFESTPAYDYTELSAGAEIDGPAVVDADFTSTVVPPGWSYSVDEYRNGLLRNEE